MERGERREARGADAHAEGRPRAELDRWCGSPRRRDRARSPTRPRRRGRARRRTRRCGPRGWRGSRRRTAAATGAGSRRRRWCRPASSALAPAAKAMRPRPERRPARRRPGCATQSAVPRPRRGRPPRRAAPRAGRRGTRARPRFTVTGCGGEIGGVGVALGDQRRGSMVSATNTAATRARWVQSRRSSRYSRTRPATTTWNGIPGRDELDHGGRARRARAQPRPPGARAAARHGQLGGARIRPRTGAGAGDQRFELRRQRRLGRCGARAGRPRRRGRGLAFPRAALRDRSAAAQPTAADAIAAARPGRSQHPPRARRPR